MSTKRIEEVIGQNIRTLRAGRYSQSEFGKKLGEYLDKPWPAQTVSSAEKGDRAFIAAETAAIAHVLEVPITRLFTPQLDADTVQITPKLTLFSWALLRDTKANDLASEVDHARQTLRQLQEHLEEAATAAALQQITVEQLFDQLNSLDAATIDDGAPDA